MSKCDRLIRRAALKCDFIFICDINSENNAYTHLCTYIWSVYISSVQSLRVHFLLLYRFIWYANASLTSFYYDFVSKSVEHIYMRNKNVQLVFWKKYKCKFIFGSTNVWHSYQNLWYSFKIQETCVSVKADLQKSL